MNFRFRARGVKKKVREEREGYGDHPHPKIVQIGPVVQALEQFSRMQSEHEQTLVNHYRVLLIGIVNGVYMQAIFTKISTKIFAAQTPRYSAPESALP